MSLARTLQSEDRISRYRIVGPLGAGGMGEVYLAQDQSLERNVALKILPPELVRNEERVRRFVLEAKSASSLNHPNIVTIYEIGEDRVRPAGSAGADAAAVGADTPPVHFISMELVSGETLTAKIHQEKTDLRTLLGYLAQAAEGIAKAHAAGIVHRDLKPGNIMVSKDGFTKVLDFGLAKLTERQDGGGDSASAPTLARDATSVGQVLGTAGYMSPEQVLGKAVDARSDIFSFGCILYEAATRQRPFAADSGVETMHRILNDKPAPIEELNARVPAELRRLVRRCLAKNPDQRLQSMKDVALELHEIVEEFDSLPASGSSASASAAGALGPARRGLPTPVLLAGAALIVAVGAALAVWGLRRGAGGNTPFQNMRLTTVTSRGDVGDVVLSPDGRYLAFSSGPPGQRSLWVRQIATGSEVQVLAPQVVAPYGLTFSTDGNYLFYLAPDTERAGYKALYQIPTLGGPARKLLYDVDSRVALSPDGKRVAFYRGVPTERLINVIVYDLDGGHERIVAAVKEPTTLEGSLSWSPDGQRLATIENRTEGGAHSDLVTYRVADGRREVLPGDPHTVRRNLAWMPDGRGLAVAAIDLGVSPNPQLFLVSYPSGRARRITNDMDVYAAPSIAASGDQLAALRVTQVSNLWTADAAGGHDAHPLTSASSSENSVGEFHPAADGSIVFNAADDRFLQLWTIGADGSGQRPITSGKGFVFGHWCVPGAVVYDHSGEDLVRHVWRLDLSGGDPQQLTSGSGEICQDVSKDGDWVLFARTESPKELWLMSAKGGEPRRVTDSYRGVALFAPDGQRILVSSIEQVAGRPAFGWRVIGVSGTGTGSVVPLPAQSQGEQWQPDGRAVTYVNRADSTRNVLRQRLDGGPPEPVTRFQEGQVTDYRWSPDGSRLLVQHQFGKQVNLWVTAADGTKPVQLTDFKTGQIFGIDWAKDGKSAVFSYGTANQDAVLIRNFK